jgi:hypothetical protein
MRAWPIAALSLLLATPASADALPEDAPMRGPGFGCTAPYLLHAAEAAKREVTAEGPPPLHRAMLTCLAAPAATKRPLHRT